MPTKYFITVLCLALFSFFKCGNKSSSLSPSEELQQLKELSGKTNTRIKELEKIIADSDTSSTKEKKVKKVAIDTLKPRDFNHYIEAQGMVDAELNVLAAPQMPGVVKSILVKDGDNVKAGQILAQLDASTIYQGIEEVKSGLATANLMYEKQKSLWEKNIGSEAQYIMAKSQKEQLEKKIATLQSQLGMSYIKSPVAGVVDEIKLKIGEIASPGFNGIRVVNSSKLSVKAKLSDMFAHSVKKGNPVLIFFPDLNKEIKSTLSFAAQAVNLSSRTILVESKLPPSKEFKPNQAARIKINDSKLRNVIVISSNLIQHSVTGEDYILVAEKTSDSWIVKKKTIEVLSEYNGESVIKSGLVKGDNVIISGYSELVDGQAIQI